MFSFRCSCAEIEYKIPAAAIVIISEVFPELISGNGKPVGGMLPLTTSALTTVCIPYTSVIPDAIKKEKKSFARAAVLIPLKIRKALAANTSNIPKSPSSSPIIERIKSLSANGRKRYF